MFAKFGKTLVLAGALSLGALTAVALTSTPASAASGSLYVGGPGFEFSFGEGYRSHRRHYRDRYHDRRYYGYRDTCRPRRALRKARHRGLRRAHVVRMGRRNVVVAGRRWGERVVVGFANVRGCPVRFVRAR